MAKNPEQYLIRQTAHCPNSLFPVLVYRSVLPVPAEEASATEFLERHGWEKKGIWGTITVKHFHPNVHECYGVIQGESELIFGAGGADVPELGTKVPVKTGDVIVVPAGVAHASTHEDDKSKDESDCYRYIGVYPIGSPQYRFDLGIERLEQKEELVVESRKVSIPQDPISGHQGPLVRIWNVAQESKQ
ncbi:cupin domain-containing protein [Fusarium austroafricanum]|uniref:Cupin domain-containing protein n=1 Tax=Fusarium austroafricanum TaxID=2364996 RepID=A0A8H4KK22_9HYPO|nr:cupin domain-containing protein [Fusarium austroafricanum]